MLNFPPRSGTKWKIFDCKENDWYVPPIYYDDLASFDKKFMAINYAKKYLFKLSALIVCRDDGDLRDCAVVENGVSRKLTVEEDIQVNKSRKFS